MTLQHVSRAQKLSFRGLFESKGRQRIGVFKKARVEKNRFKHPYTVKLRNRLRVGVRSNSRWHVGVYMSVTVGPSNLWIVLELSAFVRMVIVC